MFDISAMRKCKIFSHKNRALAFKKKKKRITIYSKSLLFPKENGKV
jgi:hypothetical protein